MYLLLGRRLFNYSTNGCCSGYHQTPYNRQQMKPTSITSSRPPFKLSNQAQRQDHPPFTAYNHKPHRTRNSTNQQERTTLGDDIEDFDYPIPTSPTLVYKNQHNPNSRAHPEKHIYENVADMATHQSPVGHVDSIKSSNPLYEPLPSHSISKGSLNGVVYSSPNGFSELSSPEIPRALAVDRQREDLDHAHFETSDDPFVPEGVR